MNIITKILRAGQTTKDLHILEREVMNARTTGEVEDTYDVLTHLIPITWHAYHNRQVARVYRLICDKYLEIHKQ